MNASPSTTGTTAGQRRDDDQLRDEDEQPTGGSGRSVPVTTVLLFLVGCAVMVAAAANITNLSQWADRWGQVWVFLVFFLVMAIGGRWFWTGVDAFLAAIRGKDS